MTREIQIMRNKIHTVEDSILRCKDDAKNEKKRVILIRLRKELQKMEYEENRRDGG